MLKTLFGILITIVVVILLVLVAVAIIKNIIKKKEKPKPKEDGMGAAEMIIRISLAGAIFLVLLYAMYPEDIIKYHKPIMVFVIAMIVNAVLLGVRQDWEKSSARKILRAHYTVFSIILILGVFYKITEVRSLVEDFQPKPNFQSQAAVEEFVLRVGEPIPTVTAGSGTRHKIWANKKFVAISVRPDNGKWIRYEMSAGESYWNGAEPSGRLLLEAKTSGTVIRAVRIW